MKNKNKDRKHKQTLAEYIFSTLYRYNVDVSFGFVQVKISVYSKRNRKICRHCIYLYSDMPVPSECDEFLINKLERMIDSIRQEEINAGRTGRRK